MTEFLVLKCDPASCQRDQLIWTEVGRTEALEAGSAFRNVALPPENQQRYHKHVLPGEYLVVPLEGSAHIGIELNVRDLGADVSSVGAK